MEAASIAARAQVRALLPGQATAGPLELLLERLELLAYARARAWSSSSRR